MQARENPHVPEAIRDTVMIRLFKHYIPHAVILLWLVDLVLLVGAGELAWRLRISQIETDPGAFVDRIWLHAGFAAMMVTAMIAVGVYGADSLRSMRFAAAVVPSHTITTPACCENPMPTPPP